MPAQAGQRLRAAAHAAWAAGVLLIAAAVAPATTAAGLAPEPLPYVNAIPAPADRAYPGVLSIAVDATDLQRRIVQVRESLPAAAGSDLVMLLPEWLPGYHAPAGREHIGRIAGLHAFAAGTDKPLAWYRDAVNPFAFHIDVGPGVSGVDLQYQYLASPSFSLNGLVISPRMLALQWSSLVLYPAGYFARGISIDAKLTIPAGWHFATALDAVDPKASPLAFQRTDLEILVDSPVYAGEYWSRIDLDPGAQVPVALNAFADRPQSLAATQAQIDVHRTLIQQAYKLFGARHYDHYDFLLALNDDLQVDGVEHHRCSESAMASTYFTDWDRNVEGRDTLAHEYVHSWNGKFRRPADQWTANFNEPMRNSLLWLYEGQTQYWGQVLSARARLWTREQALEELAYTAAWYSAAPVHKWRPVRDSTFDDIIYQHPATPTWPTWQGQEDYYEMGKLIWLDADTLIRQLSKGRRSLDDFARVFFGSDDGRFVPLTYTFDDVVAALNHVQAYDWAQFLHERLDSVGDRPPLDGIARGGYRLVFNETAGEVYRSRELRQKVTDLTFSLGLTVDKDGRLQDVLWNGPAYKAGLAAGTVIVAIDGLAFDPDRLKEAVGAARTSQAPLSLIVRNDDYFRTVALDYHGGLRYPHLERAADRSAMLDEIFAPRR